MPCFDVLIWAMITVSWRGGEKLGFGPGYVGRVGPGCREKVGKLNVGVNF